MTQTPAPADRAVSSAPVEETARFELSDQRKAFFDTFGFLKIAGLFREDMARITAGFEEVFANEEHIRFDTNEHLHLSERRVIIPGFITKSPDLAWLLDDDRIVGIVRTLLGEDYEYAESDGNLFFCESSWHSDIYSAPIDQYHVKLSFYLDPIDAGSGAIRVIPGTNHHRSPFAKALRRNLGDHEKVPGIYGIDHRDIPSVTVASEPGDLVLWNFRTIHASFNGGQRRRLFSVNFREPARADGNGEAGSSS